MLDCYAVLLGHSDQRCLSGFDQEMAAVWKSAKAWKRMSAFDSKEYSLGIFRFEGQLTAPLAYH